MNENKSRPKRKKRRRGASASRFMAVLLIIAAVLMSLGVFFRVLEIEVSGQAVYSAEEIVAASGVRKGDNLFLTRRFDVIDGIFGKLPYIDSVSVNKSLPNKLIISVTESYPIAYFNYNDSCYLFDANGKILEKTTAAEAGGAISVTGLAPLDPKPGEKLTAGADNYSVDFVVEVLTMLLKRDIHGNVDSIDASNPRDLAFGYLGRFTVRLGENYNLKPKFELLAMAVESLAENDAGTIDLSRDKEAHFTPD